MSAPGWPFGDLKPHAYRVVLVDAPHKFSSGPSRNPNNHYPTMTIAEIAALPIGDLAHPDGCRLFLWITMPLLHRVSFLLGAWGFRYCTARPWLKVWPSEGGLFLMPDSFAIGCGYEVRNTAELQIIAKRGKPQRLGGEKLTGHIIAPRREHSRKPDCVRDEIARLFDGPRCELFARSRHTGFEAWGNEVDLYGAQGPGDEQRVRTASMSDGFQRMDGEMAGTAGTRPATTREGDQ
jgi:N6-adenosine-specific RNA methylase IME4